MRLDQLALVEDLDRRGGGADVGAAADQGVIHVGFHQPFL